MDTGSTSTDNLIESITNTLALLRTSSNARTNATVQDGRVVVRLRLLLCSESQELSDNMTSWSELNPLCATTAKVSGTIADDCQINASLGFDLHSKNRWLLMQAQESGAVLDEEQLLFLAGECATNFDDDVDDLALNVDHVFETDQCDAFGI
ncbi:hypothetical protein Tco_0090639 [Tanacetum coccineum]